MYNLVAISIQHTFVSHTHCTTLHTYTSVLMHTQHHWNFVICLHSFGGSAH